MPLTNIQELEIVIELEKINKNNNDTKFLPHIRSILCSYLELEDTYDIVPMTDNPDLYILKDK